MGYVTGATTIKSFPSVPVNIYLIGFDNTGVYFNIYEQDINFDDITTLYVVYNSQDAAGANPFCRCTIAGVVQFAIEEAVNGNQMNVVDCSAIGGTVTLLIEYKSSNVGAYLQNFSMYAG